MQFTALKISGGDAIRILNEHRLRFPVTGQYPFLIGDHTELERVKEADEINNQDSDDIMEASLNFNLTDWMSRRRNEAAEDGFSPRELLGKWPNEVTDQGSIGIHKDVLTGKIKPEVYLGLARIERPWYLPAILKFGGWNDCPEPEVHCAFHRHWNEKYGAEITGMSGDIVECSVKKPPIDREAAIALAWEQYWYCSDIVEQGCGSVSNLAATLLHSPYWFFWWD